jgi:hypothetical protein
MYINNNKNYYYKIILNMRKHYLMYNLYQYSNCLIQGLLYIKIKLIELMIA